MKNCMWQKMQKLRRNACMLACDSADVDGLLDGQGVHGHVDPAVQVGAPSLSPLACAEV